MKAQRPVDVEKVDVTPDLAREWLGYNTHNRRLRERVIRAYAADITAGAWRWNGESIKFAADGTLLDGQHRLAAIVAAETAVPMLVIRGLPKETQETIDGGAKRKFSDLLQLRGETSFVTLAAVTRRVSLWEMGVRRTGGNITTTNAQLLQTLEKYPDLRDIALAAGAVARTCALNGSTIGLCMWLFTRLDSEDSDFFFSRLADGQSLVSGDPVYELRRTAEASKSVRGERSEAYLIAITIKAWNAYRDGTKVGQLRFRPGGANPERFPEPH